MSLHRRIYEKVYKSCKKHHHWPNGTGGEPESVGVIGEQKRPAISLIMAENSQLGLTSVVDYTAIIPEAHDNKVVTILFVNQGWWDRQIQQFDNRPPNPY